MRLHLSKCHIVGNLVSQLICCDCISALRVNKKNIFHFLQLWTWQDEHSSPFSWRTKVLLFFLEGNNDSFNNYL